MILDVGHLFRALQVPLPGNPMMAIQYLEECIGPYSEPGSSMVPAAVDGVAHGRPL